MIAIGELLCRKRFPCMKTGHARRVQQRARRRCTPNLLDHYTSRGGIISLIIFLTVLEIRFAQFLAVCRRSKVDTCAVDDIEEARLFAGDGLSSEEEIPSASARFDALQSVRN